MKLSELKEQARKILDIPDVVGEYSNTSFVCRSGGSPTNEVGVPEVHRGDQFEYNTTANGPAYAGEVVVLCRDTGALDADGNSIYITPDGELFVYEYYNGSPSSFDCGSLREPRKGVID